MTSLSAGPAAVNYDLTGVAPNPSVEFDRQRVNPSHTHGNIEWSRGYGIIRFDASVLGARPDRPAAVPGSQGSLSIRLGQTDLRRLRDAIDAVVGLADEAAVHITGAAHPRADYIPPSEECGPECPACGVELSEDGACWSCDNGPEPTA
jgi:hypothetical protein